MQWVVEGQLDVDKLIGANPSAEGGDEDGPADGNAPSRVLDLVSGFRLVECFFEDKKDFQKSWCKVKRAVGVTGRS